MESLFNKVAGMKACSFIKKRLQHWCFPVNIAKFLRAPFLQNISGSYFWGIEIIISSLQLYSISILDIIALAILLKRNLIFSF